MIVFELSSFEISSIFSFEVIKFLLKQNASKNNTVNSIIATTGASTSIKDIKLKFPALPIIIFGGSPIRVAVPPIFEEIISVNKYGIGFISNFLAIENVIGIISITVVTLSKNALTIAVKSPRQTKILIGWPFVSFNNSFAIQLNTPLFVVMVTIIIIETNKKITLKSIKFIK